MMFELVLALSVTGALTGRTGDVTNPGGKVTCTETGYTSLFTYTPDNQNSAITNVDVEIVLGSNGKAGCNKTFWYGPVHIMRRLP